VYVAKVGGGVGGRGGSLKGRNRYFVKMTSNATKTNRKDIAKGKVVGFTVLHRMVKWE
jgi:hypothetical protein